MHAGVCWRYTPLGISTILRVDSPVRFKPACVIDRVATSSGILLFQSPDGRIMGDMSEDMCEQLLQELEISQQQITALLAATADIQDWQREPVEWSFRYIAAHLATVEQRCHLQRVIHIASGDNPRIANYYNTCTDFGQIDLRESLQKWIATRQQLLDFVRTLSERELQFMGTHEAVGAITVPDTLQEMLDQDLGNLRHVYQLIIDYHEETM